MWEDTQEGSQTKRAKLDDAKLDDGFMIGGHDGSVKPNGESCTAEHVLKLKQAGARGECEERFLRAACSDPFLSRVAVRYLCTRQDGQQEWLVLENLLAGMRRPAALDLKVGSRTYGLDATPEKIREQTMKARASTLSTLGIRVVGCRMPAPDSHGDVLEGSKYKSEPQDEHEMRLFLRRFLRFPAFLQQARTLAADLEHWFATQASFAIYGSSIFFAFDAALGSGAELRIRLIDFAHVAPFSDPRYRLDTCYLDGV
jgi:hypothetical protein